MTKKILVISNMYPSEEHKTFGIFVENQVKALRAAGLEVDVISIKNPQSGKVNVMKKYLSWILQTFLNLLSKGKGYDVVHAHYVFPSGMLARWYKKFLGVPYIVTAHGGDIDKMAKKNPRIRNWTKTILQDASHVVAVGKGLHDEIHDSFGVPSGKLSILNMGVNRQVFKPYPKDQIRKELGIESGIEPILFVGNMIPEKGVRELLHAYQKIKAERPRTALFLIGASRNHAFKQELDQIIKDKDLKDVEFLGTHNQTDLAKWMSAAELFVLPSYIEGFGLVALEAMSTHTPVVGSNVGGLTYLLEDGYGVLVEPQNSDDLAQGILSVLNNPTLKEQLIQKGELKAEENAEHHLISELIKIYQNS